MSPATTSPAGRASDEVLATELLESLRRVVHALRRGGEVPSALKEFVSNASLAPRHLAAFSTLAHDGPMTVSELATRSALALPTASLLVTQLAEAGLVERREDPSDRRRTLVSVDPSHRREGEDLLRRRLAPVRRAMARMGAPRAKAMADGLATLADELSGASGQ